ncbi:MAG: YggT family protein [Armatimonadetes bacterium]|jgi:YggT family protein|nr:YggT family protein [Armatimonadota bacterium]
MIAVVRLIDLLVQALYLLVIVWVVGSWVPSLRRSPWFHTLDGIIEPLMRPFRRLLPPERMGGLDISPILFFLVLGFAQSLLHQLARSMPF